MKKLKIFIILAGILLAGILTISNKIYAVDSSANPMYLGLYNNSNARKTGFYDYLDELKNRRPSIKIVKYENAQGLGNVDYNTQIYCLRHGIGFGSEGSTAAVVPYTQYFDMKQPETIGNEYKDAIGISAGVTPNYNKIMWILNNVANPNDAASVNALFTAAGINVEDFKGDKAQMTADEMIDILESAQQMAIWYYTNPTGNYHPTGNNESLRVGSTNQDNSKIPVVSKYYNDQINYPLNELYKYLIESAETAVNGGYTYQTSATTINFNKDNAVYTDEGTNHKFGPYNLSYTNNPGITINVQADVQLGNNIKIVNNQGVEYPGNSVSEKILNANGKDFYAVIPKSTNMKSFSIKIEANYQTTDITYWSTAANIVQKNQPVVIVQKTPKLFKDEKNIPVTETPKEFDLALRKFITGIRTSAGVAKNVASREPVITPQALDDLATGRSEFRTTAVKTHTKNVLEVEKGDIVTYTIRVYNEGEVDGYVKEITDHLPAGLELTENSTINQNYQWTKNGKTLKTTFRGNDLLKAFDKNTKVLSYLDYQVECTVQDTSNLTIKDLTNVAEITKQESADGKQLKDRDSVPNNLTNDQIKNYNPGTSERGKGYEDDDDFEPLKPVKPTVPGEFDLALRKFITQVNENAVTNRIPQVDTSKFGTIGPDGKEITTMTYNHTKEPVLVNTTDIVTYTIRVYNEGQVNGYASEIKDDIPGGLEFLPDHEINKEFRWKLLDKDENVTTNVKEAVSVATDYLSQEQEKTPGANLLKAYNKATMQTPDYKDVKIAFKVTEPQTSDRIIINKAQISKNRDENGKDIKDRDSVPNRWNEGEDDQDIEKIRVTYFDLSLRKWVTQVIVIEDGKQKVKDTGHYAEQEPEPVVKVEVNRKRLQNTVVKFKYSIRVKNEGEVEGYVKEISDYIPNGLRFNKADNPDWVEKDGKIVTTKLKDTLLKPGETAEVTVTLTWINGEENMKVMVNTAEISEDYNKHNIPDRDSTPNNRKKGEDDQDDAPVTVTTVSGSAPVYIGIAATGIAIITIGGILVKRYI